MGWGWGGFTARHAHSPRLYCAAPQHWRVVGEHACADGGLPPWPQHAAPPRELTSHQRQPLNAVKVCVLDRHHAGVGKQLLWEVVDELQMAKDGQAAAGRNKSSLVHTPPTGHAQAQP